MGKGKLKSDKKPLKLPQLKTLDGKIFTENLQGKQVATFVNVGSHYHEKESLDLTLKLLQQEQPNSITWFIADVLQHLKLQIEDPELTELPEKSIEAAIKIGKTWLTENKLIIEQQTGNISKFKQ